PIRKQGNEILKWELTDKDTAIWIKVYHSGKPLSDSLKGSIQKNLLANHMKHYQLHALRVNMTKEEVNELSEDVARHMFQQMQLQALSAERSKPDKDTLPYLNLTNEVKVAFPFIDTLYNGWLTVPDTMAK